MGFFVLLGEKKVCVGLFFSISNNESVRLFGSVEYLPTYEVYVFPFSLGKKGQKKEI